MNKLTFRTIALFHCFLTLLVISSFARAANGDDDANPREELQEFSIKVKRSYQPDSAYGNSTTIMSGGKNSDLHKCKFKITTVGNLANETVYIYLEGDGSGFSSNSVNTFSGGLISDVQAIPARIEIDNKSYTYGNNTPITVTANTTIEGFLFSSNKIESTVLVASMPSNNQTLKCTISFDPGVLKIDFDEAPAFADWTPYTVTHVFDNRTVVGHKYYIVVSKIIHINDEGDKETLTYAANKPLTKFAWLDQNKEYSDTYKYSVSLIHCCLLRNA